LPGDACGGGAERGNMGKGGAQGGGVTSHMFLNFEKKIVLCVLIEKSIRN
jgi:hypothetical protein